jgi:mRNA interferase MazF
MARTIRGIRSEVEVGSDEGLLEVSVITCDNIVTLPIALLSSSRVGHLSLGQRAALDHAIRYARDSQY